MKKLLILLAALGGILLFSGCESKGWKTVDGVIVFDTPAREPGQKSVLGLKTAPMETVRVGFIGLGMRGPGAVERFTHLDGVEIKALCDLYPERVDSAQAILVRRGFPEAAPYGGDPWRPGSHRRGGKSLKPGESGHPHPPTGGRYADI